MISRKTQVLAATGAALLLTAGGVGAAALDKAVTLSVDGQTTSAHVFGSTVGDLLEAEGITVGQHDVVVPSVDAPLRDGDSVEVKYGRTVTMTIDGKTTSITTTERTVDGALAAVGMREDGAEMSVSRSQMIGRQGLTLNVVTPKTFTITMDGKTTSQTITAATVADGLSELGVKLGPTDKVTPALDTPLVDGAKIAIQRVTTKDTTRTEAIAFATTRKNTDDLYVGETKVATKGVNGVRTITERQTIIDGKVTGTTKVGATVTKAAVNKVVLVGTKAKPVAVAPKPSTKTSTPTTKPSTPSTKPSTPTTPAPTGGLDLRRSAMWDRVAACESGGRWNINTGNGYYGGLQFSKSTWLAYGGGKFAARADLASKGQQITIANKVYDDNGLSQWGCKA